MTESHVNNKT